MDVNLFVQLKQKTAGAFLELRLSRHIALALFILRGVMVLVIRIAYEVLLGLFWLLNIMGLGSAMRWEQGPVAFLRLNN